MSKIISIHSFRGGTGKSNTSANISALLAVEGYRVGVVDTDILSPGIHVLFGFNEQTIKHTLNDYLWGKCDIRDTAYDLSSQLDVPVKGAIYLIPSSIKAGEIARIFREGYDVGMLNEGFHELIDELDLDFLIVDTHPGLNEETMLSIAISDALAIILRPDQQDYQGTSVTVAVARKLDVPNLMLVVNKVPQVFDTAEVKAHAETSFECPVAAVLPHSDEMMALASGGIFSLRYPDHAMAKELKKLAMTIIAD